MTDAGKRSWHHWVLSGCPPLLLRKGRVLTPWSRFKYRLVLLRAGRSMAIVDDEILGPLSFVVRVVTLPLLGLLDWMSWPVVKRTAGRGSWWVVQVRFHHDVEVELVRIREAHTEQAARSELAALSAAR